MMAAAVIVFEKGLVIPSMGILAGSSAYLLWKIVTLLGEAVNQVPVHGCAGSYACGPDQTYPDALCPEKIVDRRSAV